MPNSNILGYKVSQTNKPKWNKDHMLGEKVKVQNNHHGRGSKQHEGGHFSELLFPLVGNI